MFRPSHQKSAAFLDRDGTLNRDVGYAHRPGDLELLDGVVPGLRKIMSLGYQLFVTTNQSGIARGLFSEADMHAFNAALVKRLQAAQVRIEAIYYCPYHPTEGVGIYRRESPLRKPGDGMLRQAADEHGLNLAGSVIIGDKESDVEAGKAAGCRAILLSGDEAPASEPATSTRADFIAPDLVVAAEWLGRQRTTSIAVEGPHASRGARGERSEMTLKLARRI